MDDKIKKIIYFIKNIFKTPATTKEFETLRRCNHYHRFMVGSGCYDNDPEDRKSNRKWGNEIDKLEKTLPNRLKKLVGKYRDEEELLNVVYIKDA